MNKNKRSVLLLLAAICFLFVGIQHYDDRHYIFYGNIITGVLFVIAAIASYLKKRNTILNPSETEDFRKL